jgi:hypothetical protein
VAFAGRKDLAGMEIELFSVVLFQLRRGNVVQGSVVRRIHFSLLARWIHA